MHNQNVTQRLLAWLLLAEINPGHWRGLNITFLYVTKLFEFPLATNVTGFVLHTMNGGKGAIFVAR